MYNIIIVDDDDGVRDSLAFHFEDCDYNVEVASSSEEAEPLLLNNSFDLAIVDLRLPKMRGDDFIKMIHDRCESTKFIIYTGSEEFHIGKDLKNLDRLCKKVLYKPVKDLMMLNKMIEEFVG